MPADIIAYRNAQAAVEAAQEEPQQWDEWMTGPQDPYYPPTTALDIREASLGNKPT